VVPCAYLKVYQPLESFPRDEQAQWERYLLAGRPRPLRPVYRQRATGRRLGVLTPTAGEGADVKLVDGSYYVCPWHVRLRVLAGMLSFREASPFEGSEAFVPDDELRRASKELAKMRRRHPGVISFMHQSPWHVPVRWFTLFDGEERVLRERRDGRYRLSYLTTTRKAMRRADRAVPALRKTDLGPVADLIVELYEWLSNFDARSLLELDYNGLCDLLTWDEMDDDHSARDVQDALSALSSEEFPRSADLYQSVIIRWAEVRNHESMN
jgi:hypothetical protein